MNRIAMTLSTILALIVANLGFSSTAVAKDAEVYTGFFSSLAVGGHDPVSYFKDGVPRLGDARFVMTYKGATWRFASQANLEAFRSNPAAYAPQYGGYCAWAVSQGYTASGDPQVWNIVGGKLYLNYNKSVQADWAKDIPGHIVRADKNWPVVLGK
jgi:YHS domain-containing protein